MLYGLSKYLEGDMLAWNEPWENHTGPTTYYIHFTKLKTRRRCDQLSQRTIVDRSRPANVASNNETRWCWKLTDDDTRPGGWRRLSSRHSIQHYTHWQPTVIAVRSVDGVSTAEFCGLTPCSWRCTN